MEIANRLGVCGKGLEKNVGIGADRTDRELDLSRRCKARIARITPAIQGSMEHSEKLPRVLAAVIHLNRPASHEIFDLPPKPAPQ